MCWSCMASPSNASAEDTDPDRSCVASSAMECDPRSMIPDIPPSCRHHRLLNTSEWPEPSVQPSRVRTVERLPLAPRRLLWPLARPGHVVVTPHAIATQSCEDAPPPAVLHAPDRSSERSTQQLHRAWHATLSWPLHNDTPFCSARAPQTEAPRVAENRIASSNLSAQLLETRGQNQSMVRFPDNPSSTAAALRPPSAPRFVQLTLTPLLQIGESELRQSRTSSSWATRTSHFLLSLCS